MYNYRSDRDRYRNDWDEENEGRQDWRRRNWRDYPEGSYDEPWYERGSWSGRGADYSPQYSRRGEGFGRRYDEESRYGRGYRDHEDQSYGRNQGRGWSGSTYYDDYDPGYRRSERDSQWQGGAVEYDYGPQWQGPSGRSGGRYGANRGYEGDYGWSRDYPWRSGGYGYDNQWQGRYGSGGRYGGDQSYGGQYRSGQGYGSQYGSGQGYGAGYASSQGYGSATEYGQDYGSQQRGRFSGQGPKGWKRSDDRIKEDVNEMLARHDDIDPSEVEVKVENGAVTLEGTVPNRWMKRHMEDVVYSAFGVQDVHNRVRVEDSGNESSRNRNGAMQSEGQSRDQSQTQRNQSTTNKK
jgi:osmotically-inducible protein OsmY